LPGEAKGIFHPAERFNEVELATSAFGQSFQITPLEMVSAVAAVANSGVMNKPHIVKQINNADGTVQRVYEPEIVRQVISRQTSETMCRILESVVTDGGGRNAYVRGYRVAGKTGTSEKQPRGNGKYIASFIGFAPANDPKVLVLVMLDEPTGGEYYGGMIAAPVAGNIIDDTLKYMNIEPQYTEEELRNRDVFMPDIRGMGLQAARNAVVSAGLKYKTVGGGEHVASQSPAVGTLLESGCTVILYTEEGDQTAVTVPDVIGRGVLDTNHILTNAGLNMRMIGSGLTGSMGNMMANGQDPPAGTVADMGSIIFVSFRHAMLD